jgi:ferredoxin
MSELINRLPQNVPGAFYVDDTCIDCDLCRSNGPNFFTRDDNTGYSYVYRQPVTPEEIAEAEDCRLGCPTESIGDDGEKLEAPSIAANSAQG